MFMRVVSVGDNLLGLGSLDDTSTAIFLDLLVDDELHSDLLRLGGLVLDDDDDEGRECRCL
jgi:hypothetical protein